MIMENNSMNRSDTRFLQSVRGCYTRVDASGLRLTPVSELAGPEEFADTVDELTETMLDKSGRVVFMKNGALDAHQRQALILRY